jgi:hypothetical protein
MTMRSTSAFWVANVTPGLGRSDRPDAGAGGRVEDATGAVDVDPFGESGVRARSDEEGQVNEGVRRFEHRFEVGRGQIEAMELERRWPECRIARVDPYDARHR